MTEEEWLSASYTTELLEFIKSQSRSRKLRYFVVSCARNVLPPLPDLDMTNALELAEAFADGTGTRHKLAQGRKSLRTGHAERVKEWNPLYTDHVRSVPAWYSLIERIEGVVENAASSCAWSVTRYMSIEKIVQHGFHSGLKHQSDILRHEIKLQINLLRDIFGNPFRPVDFDPEWRTATAVALAQTMYDARNFHAMPILADALQDAGCEDTAILDHCRDENSPHVRGCWVVDLVLNKS